jgi:hypothetical protein
MTRQTLGEVKLQCWCYTSVEILGLPWLNTVPLTPGAEVNFSSQGTAVSHKLTLIPNPRFSNIWRKFDTNTNTKLTQGLDLNHWDKQIIK